MICFVLFIVSILFPATTGGGQNKYVAYKPTDVFFINCGASSNSNTSDATGRTWTPEQPKVFASTSVNTSFTSTASEGESSVPLAPYMTVRIIRSKFTYSFSVSPGWKFLRLHFYPTRYGSDPVDVTKSFFSATVNGFTLLNNFSPALKAKASRYPFLIKEFIVPVLGGDKTLNLTFTPSPHSLAFINGVEIVSLPDRFYTKGGFNGYVRDVDTSSNDFEIDNSTVLETVYRLNVAGDMGPDVTDTGMFRQWLPDSDVILQKGDPIRLPDLRFDLSKINYTEKTPAYVAPEAVYLSFRGIANSNHLTWLFAVDAGFNYLVRLHFCDINREETKMLVDIKIGNQIAQAETDVINMSGGRWVPIYLDFKTFLAHKSGKKSNLLLDLYPYNYSSGHIFSSSLNGIEILKLSDSKGNLATSGGKQGRP